ncbi:MAG TPA: four helix bundle protein [Brumimicrobium sp.]|nr:four helix bundle protein [Brumimicrobium sp.]
MNETKSNPLKEKSYAFAIKIVRLSQDLVSNRKEYVLSKQVLRSGTAIGALIREGEFAASKADFINKFTVSLKEANETEFWLMLLKDTDYIDHESFIELHSQCKELISMLVSSIKTTKQRLNLNDKNK